MPITTEVFINYTVLLKYTLLKYTGYLKFFRLFEVLCSGGLA